MERFLLKRLFSTEDPLKEQVKSAELLPVGQTPEGRQSLVDRGFHELEEVRVLVHTLDEDKSSGILELALHGHDIKLIAHLCSLGRVEA
jgi:hypothetical protein